MLYYPDSIGHNHTVARSVVMFYSRGQKFTNPLGQDVVLFFSNSSTTPTPTTLCVKARRQEESKRRMREHKEQRKSLAKKLLYSTTARCIQKGLLLVHFHGLVL